MSDEHESLWTSAQVAEFLSVSRSWVEHRTAAGEIPSVKIGRMRRFVPQEIRAFAMRGRAGRKERG